MKKEFLKSKILLQVSINIFTCCVEKKMKRLDSSRERNYNFPTLTRGLTCGTNGTCGTKTRGEKFGEFQYKRRCKGRLDASTATKSRLPSEGGRRRS